MKRLLAILLLANCTLAQDLPEHPKPQHKAFFDHQNIVLFAGVATVRVLDLHSTWRFRSKGYNEGILSNGFVDNKVAFTAFSIGMVGAHIGGCYLLHRTGLHKLERMGSYIHIGLVGRTVAGNYRL
jgi:hypothetical protein